MTSTPKRRSLSSRPSKRALSCFDKYDKPIEARDVKELARQLVLKYRCGNVPLMTGMLEKRLKANQVFMFEEGGKIYFESRKSRRRRLGLPATARKSAYINDTRIEAVAAA